MRSRPLAAAITDASAGDEVGFAIDSYEWANPLTVLAAESSTRWEVPFGQSWVTRRLTLEGGYGAEYVVELDTGADPPAVCYATDEDGTPDDVRGVVERFGDARRGQPHVCEQCGDSFASIDARDGHRKQVHPQLPDDIDETEFREIVADADVLLEVQQATRCSRERVKALCRRFDIDTDLIGDPGENSPQDVLEAAGVETGVDTPEGDDTWRQYSQRGQTTPTEFGLGVLFGALLVLGFIGVFVFANPAVVLG